MKNKDRQIAEEIATEIRTKGGSVDRWSRADQRPEIAAMVLNLVTEDPTRTTAKDMLEQFYRYGEMGLPRGGKVWKRPTRAER